MGAVLACWIGDTDLRAAALNDREDPGPIARVVSARRFDRLLLLSNRDPARDHVVGKGQDKVTARVDRFLEWLRTWTDAPYEFTYAALKRPTDHAEIYLAVRAALQNVPRDAKLTFHLSPGTPAMASIWVLLGKTMYAGAELVESSVQEGVRTVDVPFDLAAEYLPDLLRRRDEALTDAVAARAPENAAFSDILHRSPVMKRLIERAARAASFAVSVVIEGESGTGKELLARAIHGASPRAGGPFVAVNCGAIPEALFESEIFGHKKGSFTGATTDRIGYLEAANRGTLFLDEIGELPLAQQVKLLRVLQEQQVTRVGETRSIPVDVRVVVATNRRLIDEVAAGRFREDLYYRLAVATLRLPPLREREGDLGLLIERLFEQVQRETAPDAKPHKSLSVGARNALLRYDWPGNVRELRATLQRVIVWSSRAVIEGEDIHEALHGSRRASGVEILGRPLGEGLDLPELLADVARHYLSRAMQDAHGNKTRAAELVGLASYQTLSNWLDRYDLDAAGKPVAPEPRRNRSGRSNARGSEKRKNRGAA